MENVFRAINPLEAESIASSRKYTFLKRTRWLETIILIEASDAKLSLMVSIRALVQNKGRQKKLETVMWNTKGEPEGKS